MHILTLPLPLTLADDDVILPDSYVLEDVMAAQLLCHAGEGKMTAFDQTRPFDERADWNGKNILISRMGALGDLVYLAALIREIARRWPLVKIHVCALKENAQVLMNLTYVHDVIPAPITLEALVANYDCWIFLENALERNPDVKKMHITDVFAKCIGLTGKFNRMQDYCVSQHEAIWAEQAYPRQQGKRRICVQIGANALIRTYSMKNTGKVVAMLLERGWEVFLMARPGEVQLEERPGIRLVIDGFSFRQRCAVLATSDCVLSMDSSLTAVAGALDVPCVALFGPTNWENRTKYNDKTVAIAGDGRCAPCNHVATSGHNQFPPQCPSAAKGHCQVLDSIEPDRVVAKIEALSKKYGGYLLKP